VEDPASSTGEKQADIQIFEIRNSPAGGGQECEIVDTDLQRCTQIQKPMNSIAFGEKKAG
jgi:hypothetical protein